MTAVVEILNKQAVAIAADSAVTISGSNGRKIFNQANKVFTLSKFHPVGIMIYNSASFMGTPWETIIKIYRKNLALNRFNTVKEYQEDFIGFLKSKNYYSNQDDEGSYFLSFAQNLMQRVVQNSLQNNRHLLNDQTPKKKEELLNLLEAKIESYILQFETEQNYCEEFIDYSYADFNSSKSSLVDQLINQIFTENDYSVSELLGIKIKQLIYVYLRTKESNTDFTGLIFTGFGENEIYPSLIPINISFAVGDRLRFYIDDDRVEQISKNNDGAICPFAQTDVINTILTGIDPKLDDIYNQNFSTYFSKYNQAILDILGEHHPELAAQIRGINIEELVNEYADKNLETKQTNYINPLMNAVSYLSKEDLAEMAESLIYLTYLKRRITFAEESVGGPVDVAIISKGDGFIWIKRKHYFKPELNQYFFQNYLNNL